MKTMGYILLLLTQMVFFREIHVFIQLSWIGLFGTTWDLLHLENYDLHEVFIQINSSDRVEWDR
jgi:hypothetical protein